MNAREVFGHWDTVRRDLLRGLELFTDEELDFRPAPVYQRTVGDIARHIAEAEDGWFHYVVRGEHSAWPEYSRDAYPTRQSVINLLERVHEKTLAWLETVDEDDLDQVIRTPWNAELSLQWIIWHVLEHEIHHRGELYLCLGLLGKEAPDI
ncbi:MAG TPA: DinB family protein [Caldilineae bacterium]|jgi:uncharacterized damage-inducible protein DinB|nr:DinB family protein [Caldilineae bacterium]